MDSPPKQTHHGKAMIHGMRSAVELLQARILAVKGEAAASVNDPWAHPDLHLQAAQVQPLTWGIALQPQQMEEGSAQAPRVRPILERAGPSSALKGSSMAGKFGSSCSTGEQYTSANPHHTASGTIAGSACEHRAPQNSTKMPGTAPWTPPHGTADVLCSQGPRPPPRDVRTAHGTPGMASGMGHSSGPCAGVAAAGYGAGSHPLALSVSGVVLGEGANSTVYAGVPVAAFKSEPTSCP